MAKETDVLSIRLPTDEVEGLHEEADELGFDSTNKYVKWLLKHRDPPDNLHPLEVYNDRLNTLEDRVEDLEEELAEERDND